MKNHLDSDYATNRYSQGIVYRFVDKTVEITLEDYLHENPGRTETEFLELKVLSDEIYFEHDRGENIPIKRHVFFYMQFVTEV